MCVVICVLRVQQVKVGTATMPLLDGGTCCCMGFSGVPRARADKRAGGAVPVQGGLLGRALKMRRDLLALGGGLAGWATSPLQPKQAALLSPLRPLPKAAVPRSAPCLCHAVRAAHTLTVADRMEPLREAEHAQGTGRARRPGC